MKRGYWTDTGLEMSSLSLKCLLIGHEDSVQSRGGRLFLHCAECGRDTPGWDLAPPAKRAATAVASADDSPHGLRHFFAQMLRLLPFPTRP